MEKHIEKDIHYQKALKAMQVIYIATAVFLVIKGIINRNLYDIVMPIGTLIIFPAMGLVYKTFKWKKSYQMELSIYIFTYLGFTLGGAASLYQRLPGYDKLVHMLSGIFVSMLAFALYLLLEKDNPKQNPLTAAIFVFFASMAVAGLFEIGEYLIGGLINHDFQQVAKTGITDTMVDMIVCLVGSLLFSPLIFRFYKGKTDPLTGAVGTFIYKNAFKTKTLCMDNDCDEIKERKNA